MGLQNHTHQDATVMWDYRITRTRRLQSCGTTESHAPGGYSHVGLQNHTHQEATVMWDYRITRTRRLQSCGTTESGIKQRSFIIIIETSLAPKSSANPCSLACKNKSIWQCHIHLEYQVVYSHNIMICQYQKCHNILVVDCGHRLQIATIEAQLYVDVNYRA